MIPADVSVASYARGSRSVRVRRSGDVRHVRGGHKNAQVASGPGCAVNRGAPSRWSSRRGGRGRGFSYIAVLASLVDTGTTEPGQLATCGLATTTRPPGQFLSRNPAVAMTREPYAYVGDNPLNATDRWWVVVNDHGSALRKREALQLNT